MKTLYVSDLDGTLLRSDEHTSEYTNRTINELIERGMLFSYATARSHHTSRKVTAGLEVDLPLILYNGTMVVGPDGSYLLKNTFGSDVFDLLTDLLRAGVFPIVYSFLDGEELFSFIPSKCSYGMREFIGTRRTDRRIHPVDMVSDLYRGEIFYITCIDAPEKLEPLYDKYRSRYRCVYQIDMYTSEQWLEIMPREASKGNAARQLKEHLGCDRLVVFGDGENDVEMFGAADEAYAVSNAIEELRDAATGVIASNDEDGVAQWLRANYKG